MTEKQVYGRLRRVQGELIAAKHAVNTARRDNLVDAEFLKWIADRLVQHYGENPSTDFVLRLNQIIQRMET